MANRMIRDWTDSHNMDKVSFQAEVLFTRLMMKADDYGCFHANVRLVNSFCFPLKNIRDSDITRWLQELVTAGLIVVYEADSKRYLQLQKFGQRLRQMTGKYPLPESADIPPPELEVEEEGEIEEEKKADKPHPDDLSFKNLKKKKKERPPPDFKMFGAEFIKKWGEWLEYKRDEHRFSYKSEKTEQAAIDHVIELSGSDEQRAIKILKQSIDNSWKGLFPLKNEQSTTVKTGNSKSSAGNQLIGKLQSELASYQQRGEQDNSG